MFIIFSFALGQVQIEHQTEKIETYINHHIIPILHMFDPVVFYNICVFYTCFIHLYPTRMLRIYVFDSTRA